MIWEIAFLLLFSLFSVSSVSAGGGSGVTFMITNEAAPGTRPPPPIPDLIEGPIGRDYYTKIDGGVYIRADYSVEGTPEQEVNVRWFKDGEEVQFNLNRVAGDDPPVPSFSITSSIELFPGDTVTRVYQESTINADSSGSAFLYLTDIDSRFVGRYTFEVFSGSDTASASSNVILGTPPELITTPPDVKDPPRDGFNQIDLDLLTESRVTCDTGSDVYATFNGDPAPTVTCTDTLGAGEQVSVTNADPLQTSVKYTVPALPVSTQTVVTCTAVNEFGTATKDLTLISFGTPPRLPSVTRPPPVACTRADAVVSARENEIACGLINEGQITITQSLDQEGIPLSDVTWRQRDTFGVVREVTEGGRYTITRQGQNRVLTIQRPQLTDEGDYWIVAENCAGSVSTNNIFTTFQLYMRPDIEPEHPIIPPEGSCQNNPAYTTINVQGVDIVVTGDRPVCITCPSIGIPPPTYSWMRDGFFFAPIQGPSNAAYLDTTGLVFRDQPNCFQCSATNIAGVDASEVCVQLGLPLAYRLRNNGCTKTCGGGVIDYSLSCVEIQGNSETEVDPSLCIAQQIERPAIPTTTCNEIACPPQFLLGAWSPCSSSCEEGVRTRTVRCRQIGPNGLLTDVAISVCEQAFPNTPESSEVCVQPDLKLAYGLLSNGCTKTCGGGVIDFSLICVETDGGTEREVDSCLCVTQQIERPVVPTPPCNAVPCPPQFLLGAWSTCSPSCDDDVRTRTVKCRQIAANGTQRFVGISVCENAGLTVPQASEACPVRRIDGFTPCDIPRNYAFLTSEWSSCSHSCQEGRRTRTIQCREIDRLYGGFGGVYQDEVCISSGLEETAAFEICGSGSCNSGK